MENVCRLCGHVKKPRYLITDIDDPTMNIQQKLIDCCRWNLIGVDECGNMPKKICSGCIKKLEKCWIFLESVAQVQEQLHSHVVQIKTELIIFDGIENNDDDKEEIIITSDSNNRNSDNNKKQFSTQHNSTNNEPIDKNNSDESKISNNFLCDICGKNFSSKPNLTTHRNMHRPKEKRKYFECYICETTFSYKKSLIHHMPTHTGKKIRHECGVCKLNFSRRDALQRHTLIHLGQSPYECSVCGKGFRTKFNLTVIIKICCFIYVLVFMNIDFQIHERTHNGERPYPCPYCRYRSSTGPNLAKHIKKQHNDQRQLHVIRDEMRKKEKLKEQQKNEIKNSLKNFLTFE